MSDRDIVVKLSPSVQETIANGLAESAENAVNVYVMIQEDGIKFKMGLGGHWTPPQGSVQS